MAFGPTPFCSNNASERSQRGESSLLSHTPFWKSRQCKTQLDEARARKEESQCRIIMVHHVSFSVSIARMPSWHRVVDRIWWIAERPSNAREATPLDPAECSQGVGSANGNSNVLLHQEIWLVLRQRSRVFISVWLSCLPTCLPASSKVTMHPPCYGVPTAPTSSWEFVRGELLLTVDVIAFCVHSSSNFHGTRLVLLAHGMHAISFKQCLIAPCYSTHTAVLSSSMHSAADEVQCSLPLHPLTLSCSPGSSYSSHVGSCE